MVGYRFTFLMQCGQTSKGAVLFQEGEEEKAKIYIKDLWEVFGRGDKINIVCGEGGSVAVDMSKVEAYSVEIIK